MSAIGTEQTCSMRMSAIGGKADIDQPLLTYNSAPLTAGSPDPSADTWKARNAAMAEICESRAAC